MTISEVLPSLRELNHKDKIRAIQFLANEVAREEEIFFEADKTYEVWSPFDSGEAALQLNTLLENESKIG